MIHLIKAPVEGGCAIFVNPLTLWDAFIRSVVNTALCEMLGLTHRRSYLGKNKGRAFPELKSPVT